MIQQPALCVIGDSVIQGTVFNDDQRKKMTRKYKLPLKLIWPLQLSGLRVSEIIKAFFA